MDRSVLSDLAEAGAGGRMAGEAASHHSPRHSGETVSGPSAGTAVGGGQTPPPDATQNQSQVLLVNRRRSGQSGKVRCLPSARAGGEVQFVDVTVDSPVHHGADV